MSKDSFEQTQARIILTEVLKVGRKVKMTKRFKVYESELMELEDDEQLTTEERESNIVIVVLEEDYLLAVEDDRGVL